MPPTRPGNTKTKPGNMQRMPSTARTWRKPGRKATALPPGKEPDLLKSGQIQPGSGRRAPRSRTEFPGHGPLKPGRKQHGPGRKVLRIRMGLLEPSPVKPGLRFLPKKLLKHPPAPRLQIPVPKPLPAVQRRPRLPRKKPPPRLPLPGRMRRVPPRNWLKCRLI